MRQSIFFFIFFFYFVCTIDAQNKKILDSLNIIYKQANNDTTQLLILSEIAKQYRQALPDSTIFLGNKGLELSKKINYERGIAINLNILGMVEVSKGNYLQAITYLFEGLKINEKIQNQKDISTNLNNIGEVYRLQNNYDEAVKYYNKSMLINEKIENKEGVAVNLNNLGEIYTEKNNYEEALAYFFKSMKICEEINNESRIALRLNNIGEVYAKQKKYAEALESYFKAIKISKKFNDKLHITRELNNIANIYLQTKDFKQSLEYAKKSLAVAKEINAKNEIKLSLKTITNIYTKLKDYYNAFTYYQLFVSFQDSLNNEEVIKKMKDIQFNYEINQKQKEILLLETEKNLQKQNAYTRLLYIVFFIVFIVLLLILAAILYQKNKFKVKANVALKEKNESTESQNKELNNTLKIVEMQKQEMLSQNEELYQQQEELFSTNEALEATFKQLKTTSDRLNKSIQYANQIQQLILPKKAKLDSFFSKHFAIFLPKDIVSGDFYWFTLLNDNKAIFVLADCTGHGVPGAFMSMIGNTLLHEIIKTKNINSPAEILSILHQGVRNVLKQEESKNSDGMDIAVCLFEKDISQKEYKVTFAGAKSSIFYVKDKLIHQLNGDKITVGGFTERKREFINQTFTLKEGEIIYFTSDGYIDQNNVNRERFGSFKFKQLLNLIYPLPIEEQQKAILFSLKEHQQDEEQRDDISVVGIKL